MSTQNRLNRVTNKIITGHENSSFRKSRFHDAKGNFIGWSRLIKHTPIAVMTTLARVLFGYRFQLPWISYQSIFLFNSFLNKDKCVFEFGSGMSTVWYAKHSKFVTAVEDDGDWYAMIDKSIKTMDIVNVDYIFCESAEDYTSIISKKDTKFDLIVVDGSCRDVCMQNAIKFVNIGGIIYLDNSDAYAYHDLNNDHVRQAEITAIEFARKNNFKFEFVTDFSPGQLFVHQALIIFC